MLPTSNIVESLFSRANYALSDWRKAVLPPNLEAQLYLHANASLWTVDDVSLLI